MRFLLLVMKYRVNRLVELIRYLETRKEIFRMAVLWLALRTIRRLILNDSNRSTSVRVKVTVEWMSCIMWFTPLVWVHAPSEL